MSTNIIRDMLMEKGIIHNIPLHFAMMKLAIEGEEE